MTSFVPERTIWSVVTTRVAWTLVTLGVRVSPEVLRDARDHVFLCLEPGLSLEVAEDRAGRLSEEFVARARGRAPPTRTPMALSTRWRTALDPPVTTRASRAVFHGHFGDRQALPALVTAWGVDIVELEAARGGLREVLRVTAAADGVALSGWADDRIDGLLERLGALPGPDCPPMDEVFSGEHAEHVARCLRCGRAPRLVRAGVLAPQAFEPRGVVGERLSVLVLQLHPDTRQRLGPLLARWGQRAMPLGGDCVVLEAGDLDVSSGQLAAVAFLDECSFMGQPGRDHLRATLITGEARWSDHGLLGPITASLSQQLRGRPWGTCLLDALVYELPATAAPPPSAKGWWAGVVALGLLVLLVADWWGGAPPLHGLDVGFVEGRGGLWAEIEVDEPALLTVVSETQGALMVVFTSAGPADKAALAVGDGGYRLHATGRGLLVAASEEPLVGLEEAVATARAGRAPLQELRDRLSSSTVAIELSP